MKINIQYILIPALAGLTALSPAQAQAPTHVQAQATHAHCDLNDVQTIYWEPMEQFVTLTTRLKTGDYGLPRGTLTLALADGTEVDLGGGGKYYDEAPSEFSGCENHLQAAKSSTISSLTATGENNPYNYRTTLQDFSAFLVMGQDCQEAASRKGQARHEMSEACQLAISFMENYNDQAAGTGGETWPEGRYQELRALDAPIIYVSGSTYYTIINVYDPIDNILRELMYDGC